MSTTKLNLDSVPETLLLPLWARAELSRRSNPVLVDKDAIDIIDRLDYDFTKIKNDLNYSKNIIWLSRARQFDDLIRQYIKVHPKAVIVNIGAGLDTTFNRVDNGAIKWYDLDLPEVIDIRKQMIPETDRSKCIAASAFDDSWHESVINSVTDGLMFMAAGVFFYFEENEARGLFGKLAGAFPGSELIFDAISPAGLEKTNNMLGNVGMKKAVMRWGMKSAKVIESWHPSIKLIRQFETFNRLKTGAVPYKTRIMITANKLMKVMTIVHCRFE